MTECMQVNGEMADMPYYYRKQLEKLAIEMQRLDCKVKGSKNYEKQRIKVAKIQEKIANQGEEHYHLYNRATQDNSFGQFRNLLAYKMADNGRAFLQVDKWYASSKTSRFCGYKNKDLTLEEREWDCPCCHTHLDRDLNAAINLRNNGVKMLFGQVTQVGKNYLTKQTAAGLAVIAC